MIPFDPGSPLDIWWFSWKISINKAHALPREQEFYCAQAMNAQMNYVCYVAQALAKKENS